MGRVTVRAAIAQWLAPGNVPGLTTLFAAPPKRIEPEAFGLAANQGSGAIAIVHMPEDSEVRKAMGGQRSGLKYPVHKVSLEVKFQSNKTDAIAAQADYDALIDAFVVQMRADRNFGAPTVIWQAGEFAAGIAHQQSEPVLSGTVWQTGGLLKFEAWESTQT